jgi:hypothetical protein
MKLLIACNEGRTNGMFLVARTQVGIYFLLSGLFANTHVGFGGQDVVSKENQRPRMEQIKEVVEFVPAEYQRDVLIALKKSGRNGHELMAAIQAVSPLEREGMAFLIANMPAQDLVILNAEFLVTNVRMAYQTMREVPWAKDIPQGIFLNEILPYASFNEQRDNWRKDFHDRFIQIAQESKSIEQAVQELNQHVFTVLQVTYHATKRPKPEQSPYESMRAHYASCTGLSILLTDALRSVGIPARIAGIPMWADQSGNHTWVEIWDGEWHHLGAYEPTKWDEAWFRDKAAQTDSKHPIYATSFKKTSLSFPMRWAPYLKFVPAVDVTTDYTH